MFAGHVAIAVGATQRRLDVPLWALIAASLAPDLMVFPLWHTAPFTLVLVVAAFVAGAIAWDRDAGLLLALLVVSHYAVDLLTSDLNVWPNSGVEVGLGLYDLPALDFVLEGLLIVGGWLLWRRAVAADGESSRSMLLVLLVSQAMFDLFVSSSANDG